MRGEEAVRRSWCSGVTGSAVREGLIEALG